MILKLRFYRRELRTATVWVLLFSLAPYSNSNAQNAASQSRIKAVIACGDDKVVIIGRRQSHDADLKIDWQWAASTAPGLPDAYKRYFRTTDDCKPVDRSHILITSSGGGVALVNRKTKATRFYAHVPNAHSAALLPRDRIVVALSTAAGGNRISLFDIHKPDQVLFEDSLYSGHGAVWLPRRKRLIVLGYDVIRAYALKNWKTDMPSLQREGEWKLPDNGGHDLSAISADELLLTTTNGVWRFDLRTNTFATFEPLQGMQNVKSVNYDKDSGELVFTKGEISWWTHNIYFRNPADTLIVPDIDVYKVRVTR